MLNKKNYTKYAEIVKEGVKGTAKRYKKYAPKIKKGAQKTHRFLRKTAESISESMAPAPHRKYPVDLTPQVRHMGRKKYSGKIKKVKKGRDFYLDFTQ